jgi:uncharacterized small protein (DUF1192 family)
MIELSRIRIDGGTQPRAELNQDTVAEYRDAYLAGATMPAVTLFFDGAEYWLADGFHRFFAAKAAGKEQIVDDVIPGTVRDAILFSLSANSRHGLKRSNADKRRAVETLLSDPEWSGWSDNAIAKACAVSQPFVGEVRKGYLITFEDSAPDTRTVQRNGTTYEQNVSLIGKGNEQPTPDPRHAIKAHRPKLLTEEESAQLLADNERLKEIAETLAADAQSSLDDNLSMAKVFEADDKLAAATKEIDRLRAEVKQLQLSLNGKMNECSELNRLLKFWKRKAEQLEKAAA